MLHIQSNGSKWRGDAPDSVDKLIEVLGEYALDPTFENYGKFYQTMSKDDYLDMETGEKYDGKVHFSGNFFELSHVFSIYTDEAEVIERLQGAIDKNMASEAYQKTRSENFIHCDECGCLSSQSITFPTSCNCNKANWKTVISDLRWYIKIAKRNGGSERFIKSVQETITKITERGSQ